MNARQSYLIGMHCLIEAAVLVPCVAPRAIAQPEYEGFHVEAFDPGQDLREVYLWDVNEIGETCGSATGFGYYDAFVWTVEGGKARTGPMSWPYGMNNIGHVVGGSAVTEHETGSVRTVESPDNEFPYVRLYDVNDNEVAVGYTEDEYSNYYGLNQIAIVWDPQRGTRTIDVPDAKELVRVNNSDIAVGNIRRFRSDSEAFVYDVESGELINLSDELGGWADAEDISESGLVTGRSRGGGFLWSSSEGFTFLPGLNGGDPSDIYPRGVNSAGQVVGFAVINSERSAFIWDEDRGMRELRPHITGLPPDYNTRRAMGISENGWIVGDGRSDSIGGFATAFVLRPLTGSLSLSQTDLRRGEGATFTVSGANDGERVYYLYSFGGTGEGPCPRQLGGLCIDLLNPVTNFGSALADGAGVATLTMTIPGNAPLRDLSTQAVIRRGPNGADSVKSNTITDMIQP